ncbi:MAG: Adenylate cyclase [candidate division TM6 bacterium GW2011_GWF2_43_87]|nr:MAG: Adenylate cyclase [candidate division TM6 bacterium GW2011_GWF2_43_87]
MNTIEIELRYEVLDVKSLELFTIHLELLHKKHDIDVYFDTPDASFYQWGLYFRVRNNKKFEIKFNRACLEDPKLPRQDFCEEHGFSLPLQVHDLARLNELLLSLSLTPIYNADLETLKEANNLVSLYTVDKIRTSYKCGNFVLAVDEVAGLGMFLEIELMAQSTEGIEAIKQEMQCALAGLKIKPSRVGYDTLQMKKINYQQYLRGRFISELEEVVG